MNKLERVVLDQHARVKAAGEVGHQVLGEAKGEILSVATPEQVQEVLDKTIELARLSRDPVNSHLFGIREPDSLPRRLAGLGGSLYELSDSGLIVPRQGYVGLISLEASGQAYGIFGFSVAQGQKLQEDDPIQGACGPDFFYPPMMWAKALYSEAYNNRPESQGKLTMQVWLAELAGEGLFQGSKPGYGGLLGATGFMPSVETMAYLQGSQPVRENIESESTKEFRTSVLMDQAALIHLTSDFGISQEEVRFQAKVIISAGGSLN